MNPETKRKLQIRKEAILTTIGLVGGGSGLLFNGVATAYMIINGAENLTKNIEEIYSGYKLNVFVDLTHNALAAGIPLQVVEGGLIATSLALLTDGIFRYRRGRMRFDNVKYD